MKAFYTDHFVLPLPPEHRFPMLKYWHLRERIVAEGIVLPENLLIPDAATDEQLLRAHDANYVERVKNGLLTTKEIRRIGFPWSPEMVERSRRSSGATIAACRAAFGDGIAVNLAGGTHHAFRDHGEGYCVFNDSAVAARAMQAEGLARRVVILDCDVHQGNGTAAILAGDSSIFTFSIHGEKNFPFHKEVSDSDLELPDGTGDGLYLEMLEEGVTRALSLANADIAIYLAGADPYMGDRLGRLKLSMDGLAARDRFVLGLCRAEGLPVAVTMAGGYAREVEDIVAIHVQTVRIAAEISRK
jgi:acetoin utilization deacetylase AcuC-like enzyme